MSYIHERPRSLVELGTDAMQVADAAFVTFVRPGPNASAHQLERRTLAELRERAAELGGALLGHRIQQRERVLVVTAGDEVSSTLVLGAIFAGAVPVPLTPPFTASELATYPARVLRASQQTGARLLIAPSKLLQLASKDGQLQAAGLRCLSLEALRDAKQLLVASDLDATHPACVLAAGSEDARVAPLELSHGEVLAALDEAAGALRVAGSDVLVSWLPVSEPAGLLSVLLPLYCRISAGLVPTAAFLKRPAIWLEAMSRVRGTLSYAPHRAYAMCAQRNAEPGLEHLDLSRWRLAASVAERTPTEVRAAFARRFGSVGFRGQAFVDAPVLQPFRAPGLPLSEGQKSLWFLAHVAPDSAAYNVSLCLRIRSSLDAEALEAALEQIAQRHPALRSCFGSHAGAPHRRAIAPAARIVERIDAAGWSEAELAERSLREVERRFDLEAGPLFLARLLIRGPSDAVLLLVAHHIIVDGLSMVTIVRELAELYPRVLRAGAADDAPLPASTHGYDDFVRWQAQLLAGREGQRLRAYWQGQLAGAPSSLALPAARARPRVQSFRGAEIHVRLPDSLTASLRTLAQGRDTTLYTVLLGVFDVLLARVTGQRDLVVATPSMGRGDAAFAEVVGYFVNTLPIRARLEPDLTFLDLIDRLRATVLEALDHQALPFNKLVEQLGVPRDPSRTPLCQVLFQLHTYRGGESIADLLHGIAAGESARFGGLVAEPYNPPRRVAQFELALDLVDFGGTVSGRLEYNPDLFDDATVQGWASLFVRLAQELAQAPAGLLEAHVGPSNDAAAAPVALDAATRQRVLREWNDTRRAYPDGRVHRAIEQAAASGPERIALSAGDARLTYAELNRRANRLARELRALGAGRDVLVGVCMDRSIELVTVLLATLKAGAAYVPLDPSYPRERLDFMVQDAEPAVLVVDAHHAELVAASSARLLSTDAAMALAFDETIASDDLPDAPEPSDLAYVIYTSGSTGRPKGTGNVHAGLWNRLCWMQEYLELTENDCVLHKTPYSFDVSVWELFWPLMQGARLAIARPEGHKDSSYLAREIESRHVTVLHFVPSMLEAFLHEPDLGRAASLRAIVCSGEALPYATMQRCLERLPRAGLYNLYGPTEASIDVTAWKCEPNARGVVPIGRPIANTQIYILDERLAPVAIGAAGELYIGGVGLARGYHRRPELTAERFIPDPFSLEPNARLYKTGDLARFDADGTIEYLGRNDDQIKLRGFRIELGEIEAALREHPAVRACAVVARRMPSQAMQLEAFAVAAAPSRVASGALLAWLGRKLPEHMVPSRLTWLDAMPLTHSGKADRRALLELAPPSSELAYGAPSTPEERILAEVWAQVLGVEKVSVHDNYFSLGGDSIRSLQVRALARERGLDLQVHSLLAHQTIAELAASLASAPAPAPERTLAAFALVRPSERATLESYEDAFPATQLQLGMLYHSALTRESWAYHDVMSLELELRDPWSESAMRDALATVVQRHPALRSAFDAARYTRPLQVVHPRVELPFAACDLRGLGPAESSAVIRQHIEQEKLRGYELSRAPLFRVTVHVLSDARVRLTLGFHHAILDGWSTATLLSELLTEYLRGAGTPGLPALPEPLHSPATYAELELQAVASESSRAYFESTLAECDLTRLPRWPEAERRGSTGAARLQLHVGAELSLQLRELAARLRVPLKAVLLAAHARTLAVFSGSHDVVTGWVAHGRPEFAGAERILGLFLNTLPVRLHAAERSWAELVAEVARRERELHPHRRFPLREVQRRLDRKQLFETAFNFVHFHQYQALLAHGALRVVDFEAQENTSFTLFANFVTDPRDAALTLHLEYDAQQLAEPQALQLAGAHLRALEHMVRDVDASVDTCELIADEERAQLDGWSRGTPAPAAEPLHVLFERQVAQTPDRVAAQIGDESLRYVELDGWANHVARLLRDGGARKGDVVAVCAEPSLQRMAAVLGVLKAGGCCLPLAPDLPVERLQYMLDKAGARIAVTTRTYAGAPFWTDEKLVVVDRRESAPRLDVAVALGDPAYAIFTSGSTGRPKAIVMPHEPLANIAAWQRTQEDLEDGAATLQFSLFSFDVAFQEMFCTWATGGRLVIAPEAARSDTRELAKLMGEQGIARLFVPVVVLHQLAEVAEQLGHRWPHLRSINTAGEQLEITAAVRQLFRDHPQCRLHNHYGPSETHVATAHSLAVDPDAWPARPPIGRPLPGVRAYVLDAAQRRVPVGVAGELFLGGRCLALGYRHDSERTEERFQANPFERASGERLYRTGDVVRYLSDGTLEYIGRQDAQLKIRGYRVELGEIESALVELSDGRVQRAVALAVDVRGRGSQHELVAYVVGDPGRELDVAQLKAALARRLPDYMLPAQIVALDSLPLLPSGKLDRRALPRLTMAPATGTRRRVPPEGALETELCGLWQEVLGSAEQVLGVTDDFFACGGDSLTAVRLMARVQRRFGVELPISALIEAPTVRDLARVIAGAGTAAATPALVRLNGARTGRPPVFCIHPVGGHVLCYLQLARRLGADQPCYGVQARGLHGGEPLSSIVEMASVYAAEIMAVQPHGPVHLTGWSFGGVVAIEVGRQLGRAGREVAPIVLIDSVAKARLNVEMSEDDLLQFVVLELFGVHVADAAVAEVLGRERPRDRAESQARIRELAALARERGVLPADADFAQLESVIAVIQSNVQAVYDYAPSSYPGPVVLLRCTEPLPDRLRRLHDLAGTTYLEDDNGWSPYCPRLHIQPIAGDHVSVVFEPYVERVADVLRSFVAGDLASSAAE